jgi:hypothetical protein
MPAVMDEGRPKVAARRYDSRRYSGGGTFWWYFVEEVSPGNTVFRTLQRDYRLAN